MRAVFAKPNNWQVEYSTYSIASRGW